MRNRRRLEAVGQGEVRGSDDAVVGLKKSVFENAGELAHVAGPGMLEKAGEGAGPEDDGALLIAGADAVKEELGERGDVFAALTKRRDGEANGGEAKGEVGKKQSLTGHLAKRSLGRGEQNGAARRAVLKILEDTEEQALAGRGEEVNAIEIGESGKGGGIGVGSEPLAGVAALKSAGGERRSTEEIAGKSMLSCAVLAFNSGDLEMGRDHLRLHEELAPGCADADDMDGGTGRIKLHERKAGGGGLRVEWSGAMHGSQPASRATQR